MEKDLNSLSELKLAKLYNKTNDGKYLDLIENRVQDLYDNNANPDTLNNEQLVLLIQKYGCDIYWTALYNKTKNSIHYCIHKYASEFYKTEYNNCDDTEQTDLFAIVREGWYKAVQTYDITKGKAGFVAYASTIMYQHYVRMTRKYNATHNGSSVNTISAEGVHSNKTESMSSTSQSKMLDNVYADTTQDMLIYEGQDYMKQKLELLKEYDPIVYQVIMLRFYGQLSQLEIVDRMSTEGKKKRNKTWVSRQIKKGKAFLRSKIPEEEYREIIKDLNK